MNYHLRSATEADFPIIINLFKEFATFENLADQMVNSVERMKVEKELFNCFLVENNDGEIVAYATYFFSYHTWIGKCLYMDDLYVKPKFRGKGIGKMLIKRVIEFGKNSGCHKLRWQVSNWNISAKGFYEKLGASIDTIEQNCNLKLD